MGTDCISLSPGELERYRKEAVHRLRCERLRQVRRREDALTQQLQGVYRHQCRQQARAAHVAELRAELEAKRQRLEGLLQEQAACQAAQGAATRAAEERQREAKVAALRAASVEAKRKEDEYSRTLEALRQCRERQLAAEKQLAAEEARRSQVRCSETHRALLAAKRGRVAAAAREVAALEVQRATLEAAKLGPQRVLRADSRGIERYANTYFHVIKAGDHVPDATDVTEIKAEFNKPLSPAPKPTARQLEKAAERGQKAISEASAERRRLDSERRRRDDESRERREKALQAAAGSVPSTGSPRWAAELLPWRVEANSKVAKEEIEDILANSGLMKPPVGLKPWQSVEAINEKRKTFASRGTQQTKIEAPVKSTKRIVTTWIASPPFPTMEESGELSEDGEDGFSNSEASESADVSFQAELPTSEEHSLSFSGTAQEEDSVSCLDSLPEAPVQAPSLHSVGSKGPSIEPCPATEDDDGRLWAEVVPEIHPRHERRLPEYRPEATPSRRPLSRRWAAEDLGARLEEICRELDEAVGVSTA
jgi:hypothetical protein